MISRVSVISNIGEPIVLPDFKVVPESIRLEDVSCPNQCHRDDEIIVIGRDLISNLPGEYTIVKCRTCGLMRTNPRPTAETIGLYYPDDYGPYLSTKVEKNNDPIENSVKKILKPLVRWIFDSKDQALPSLPSGRLLEVGCASGSFMHRMAAQGWSVEGIELSEKAANGPKNMGYKVHVGSLENSPEPDGQLDLIVGWMVLEHLHDPISCLKKLHNWTRPGGWLVLSVPNSCSLGINLFKDNWYALHLPAHLYHFTPLTLENVLHKGGWTLKKVYQQRTITDLIVSTARVFESKGRIKIGKWLRVLAGGGKWFYILFPLAWILGIFGQSGRMTVWAKKL